MSKAFVITNPMIAANKSAEVTLSKFLRVILAVHNETTIIGGNISVESDLKHVTLISKSMTRADNKLKRLLDIVILQIWMAVKILQSIKKGMPIYFWLGDKMVFPYIAAKVVKAEINYFIYGNVGKEGKISSFQRISERMIRWMAEHADYICVETPSVINEWPDLKYKQMRTIHLYTEIGNASPVYPRKNIIGMICRLTPGKHIIESIEAMSVIHEQYPDWTLEIVGSGKQEQECIAKIKETKANSYISMRGWQDHSSLFYILSNWKYLLFPSDTEGLPNGVIEAMSMGVPAIASPVGGLQDLISNGTNGYFLTGVSPVEISVGIKCAIEENKYDSLSLAAFDAIKTEYTLNAAQQRAKFELRRT